MVEVRSGEGVVPVEARVRHAILSLIRSEGDVCALVRWERSMRYTMSPSASLHSKHALLVMYLTSKISKQVRHLMRETAGGPRRRGSTGQKFSGSVAQKAERPIALEGYRATTERATPEGGGTPGGYDYSASKAASSAARRSIVNVNDSTEGGDMMGFKHDLSRRVKTTGTVVRHGLGKNLKVGSSLGAGLKKGK